jgi:hypothetical protein
MGDYHTTYKEKEGTTTEWDDIQIKLGNKAPVDKAKAAKPWASSTDGAAAAHRDTAWLEDRTADDLEDLADEFDDDRGLEAFRQKRMAELKAAKQQQRFGSVRDIGRADFVREVSNAGADVHVVVHLHQDGLEPCQLLGAALDTLADRYPGTKFLRIVSTDCIPGYPDANLPTVLLYHNTKCLQTLVGLMPYGGRSLTPEQVGFTFNRHGPFCKSPGEEQKEVAEGDIKALIQRLAEAKAAELEAANGTAG